MDVEFTIDWFSCTFHQASGLRLRTELALGEKIEKPTRKPQFGYNRINQFEGGAVIMWNEGREEMGAHLVMSGSALRYSHAAGVSPLEIVRLSHEAGGRASRIDLAIDIINSELAVTMLAETEQIQIKGSGRKPKHTVVLGGDGSWTVYCGSRSSEKFVRIYDKAKEQKNYEEDRKRIEIETKGSVAHWLGATLGGCTTLRAYALASSLIETVVQFNAPVWRAALSSERCDLAIPKKTARDTLGWLVKSCAPALARVVAENPSVDVLEIFAAALREELGLRGIEVS